MTNPNPSPIGLGFGFVLFGAADTIHPNDFGFHRMADVITPVIAEMLKMHSGTDRNR